MKQFVFVFQTWYFLLRFTLEGFKQQETQYSYELQHCKSSSQPLDYVTKTYVRLCRVTSFDGVLHIIW
jgi:prolipoprotein diacylglyceryltransferase